jgi:hypothetical protein
MDGLYMRTPFCPEYQTSVSALWPSAEALARVYRLRTCWGGGWMVSLSADATFSC